MHTDFLKDRFQVILDRVRRDIQLTGDRVRVQALDDQCRQLAFTPAQPKSPAGYGEDVVDSGRVHADGDCPVWIVEASGFDDRPGAVSGANANPGWAIGILALLGGDKSTNRCPYQGWNAILLRIAARI